MLIAKMQTSFQKQNKTHQNVIYKTTTIKLKWTATVLKF